MLQYIHNQGETFPPDYITLQGVASSLRDTLVNFQLSVRTFLSFKLGITDLFLGTANPHSKTFIVHFLGRTDGNRASTKTNDEPKVWLVICLCPLYYHQRQTDETEHP